MPRVWLGPRVLPTKVQTIVPTIAQWLKKSDVLLKLVRWSVLTTIWSSLFAAVMLRSQIVLLENIQAQTETMGNR